MPRFTAQLLAPDRHLPLVQIVLRLHSGPLLIPEALVDSGADTTVLPAESLEGIASYRSLTPLAGGGARGPGGAFEVRRCDGTLAFENTIFARRFAVAEPGALPLPVLGRDDFFRRFAVSFDWYRDPPTFDIDPGPNARGAG